MTTSDQVADRGGLLEVSPDQTPHAAPTDHRAQRAVQVRGAREGRSASDDVKRLVSVIEADVVPRLLARSAAAAQGSDPRVRSAHANLSAGPAPVVVPFTRAIVAGRDEEARALVDRLLDEGVGVDALFLSVFAGAAHELGHQWETDQVSFLDTTLALGRLERFVHDYAAICAADVAEPPEDVRIFLAVAPGEQHRFGLIMVEEIVRRAGYDVETATNLSTQEILARVQADWFDVVGFSLGRSAGIDGLRELIAGVRHVSCNPGVIILVGGRAFSDSHNATDSVRADAAIPDGARVVDELRRQLVSRDRTPLKPRTGREASRVHGRIGS